MNLTIREKFTEEHIRPEQHLKDLCRANPQMETYQQEIDFYLEHAGNAENRMAVLGFLMESHLMELHGQLTEMIYLIGRICK